MLRRRVIALVVLAWVPLLVLSVAAGHAWGDRVSVPFLHDVELHVRLLLALPLLVVAELVVHRLMRPVVRDFLARDLIPDAARHQFDAAIARRCACAIRSPPKRSCSPFVFVVGVPIIWRTQLALDVVELVRRAGGREIAAVAGRLVAGAREPAAVSVPARALVFPAVHLDTLPLARVTHRVAARADASGSLRRPGLLAPVRHAFAPFLLAQGALLAGMIANRIFFAGAHAARTSSWMIGAGGRAWRSPSSARCCCSAANSRPPSARACANTACWRSATRASSIDKWLRGGAPADEPLIGSADIQSLADLGNSFEVVKEMRLVPFTLQTALQLALTTLAPVAPLALTMVPLDELLTHLLEVVF